MQIVGFPMWWLICNFSARGCKFRVPHHSNGHVEYRSADLYIVSIEMNHSDITEVTMLLPG